MNRTKLNISLSTEEDRFLTTVLDQLIVKGVRVELVNQAREQIIEHITEARAKKKDSLEGLGSADDFVDEYVRILKTRPQKLYKYISILVFAAIIFGSYYVFLR